MNSWIKIIVKFSGRCIQCNNPIMQGEKSLWNQEYGIKHIECPVINKDPPVDESRLIIIDNEDRERLGMK